MGSWRLSRLWLRPDLSIFGSGIRQSPLLIPHYEETIVHIPLDARINRQLASAPINATSDNLLAGAHVYVARCAVCHGTPNHDSDFAKWEYPTAPQLWTKGADGVVGVSNDETGVSYWKVNNGIRLTGMPSFKHLLTQPEMWQVCLLIKQADQPQSSAVTAVFETANNSRAKAASEEMAVHASSMAESK